MVQCILSVASTIDENAQDIVRLSKSAWIIGHFSQCEGLLSQCEGRCRLAAMVSCQTPIGIDSGTFIFRTCLAECVERCLEVAFRQLPFSTAIIHFPQFVFYCG